MALILKSLGTSSKEHNDSSRHAHSFHAETSFLLRESLATDVTRRLSISSFWCVCMLRMWYFKAVLGVDFNAAHFAGVLLLDVLAVGM